MFPLYTQSSVGSFCFGAKCLHCNGINSADYLPQFQVAFCFSFPQGFYPAIRIHMDRKMCYVSMITELKTCYPAQKWKWKLGTAKNSLLITHVTCRWFIAFIFAQKRMNSEHCQLCSRCMHGGMISLRKQKTHHTDHLLLPGFAQ